MPALTNTRWELFAIGLASGKSQMKSYADAGFNKSSSGNASTLANRPELKQRVAELVEDRTKFQQTFVGDPASESADVIDKAVAEGRADRGWIIRQLMENVIDARGANQFSASNQALKILIDIDNQTDDPETSGVGSPARLVSVDQVNQLLSALGFDGKVAEVKKMPAPASAGVDHVDAC